MERHEQRSRHAVGRINGFQDMDFAGSTLRRLPTSATGQNALSTRDSRVVSQSHSQAKSRYGVTISIGDDDEDESADELDILPPPPPKSEILIAQKKLLSQTVVKPRKVEVASKAGTVELDTPSPPAIAKRSAKPSKADVETESDDDMSLFPATRPTVRKQPTKKLKIPTVTKGEGQSLAEKKGAETKKRKKKKPAVDVQEIPDSDEGAVKKNGKRPVPSQSLYKPRPFPMDLSGSPVVGSSHVSSSASRVPMSSFTSGSPGKRNHKRMESAESSGSDVADATFTYTQAVKLSEVDPESLCPFCDEKLPETPSNILLEMLERLKLKAEPDPRYGNSLGLKLDMSQYISFCTRHNAESEEFPRGQKYGWPTTLDSTELAERIWDLQSQLEKIIDDPDEGTFFRPLQETVSKYGKSAVTGAKGSWATFENASTGYYGEQGLALITQILFDMFPSIPGEKISPLELSNYYSLVLVPEIALLLIQDDLRRKQGYDGVVTRSQALKVLRKSTKYGLAIFPVAETGQANAGDDIARKRARKMRKLRDREAEEQIKSSSQNTEQDTDTIVNLSSDDPLDYHKSPVQRKRKKVQQSPLEDANGTSKRKAQEESFRKIIEPSQRPVERKVSKKRNLTTQPGGFGPLIDLPLEKGTSRRDDPQKTDSWSWLLSSQ